jgi:hypothetical protein
VPDFIPTRKADKMSWLLNNAAYAAANAAALGVPAARADLYLATVAAAQAAAAAADAAADAARSALTLENEKLADAVALAREIAAMVQANPAVSNPQRGSGGWRVHDTSRTPLPPPTAIPAAVLRPGTQWAQPIAIVVPADPTSRARPEGVDAWQVFLFVGDAAPTDVTGCRLVGQTTRPTFTIPFGPADAGRTAWILVRGVSNKGGAGPLSAAVPVTIASAMAA